MLSDCCNLHLSWSFIVNVDVVNISFSSSDANRGGKGKELESTMVDCLPIVAELFIWNCHEAYLKLFLLLSCCALQCKEHCALCSAMIKFAVINILVQC